MDNSLTLMAQGSDRLMVGAIFDDDPFQVVMLGGITACRKDGWAPVKLPGGIFAGSFDVFSGPGIGNGFRQRIFKK
ncbi:MAG: hypothetical protein V8R91_06325 [Butyricimonas faecihominis]